MEFNGLTPLVNDSAYLDNSLNNHNFLKDEMGIYEGLELNQKNMNMLNNEHYGSSTDEAGFSRDYQFGTGETVSSVTSPGGGLSIGGKNAASPLSTILDDKKRSKGKKELVSEQDAILIAKDDSELTEKELQLKRKAQNRAAQRAFRERKETKLKELQAELAQAEVEKRQLRDQLGIARQQNITMQTENKFLKNKASSSNNMHDDTNELSEFVFPHNQNEFIHEMIGGSQHNTNSYANLNNIYQNPDVPADKLLAVGAVWDYLQTKSEENEMYYTLDIVEIMKRLKGKEKCHGYGPAYPLLLIDEILAQCSQSH